MWRNQVVAVPTAFSASGYPKVRLSLVRDRYDSMGCLALTRHFTLSDLFIMKLGRGRESNVASASGRLALRTHFRFSGYFKYDFCDFEKAIIQWVSWHSQGILYFLAYPKCGLC